MTVLFIWIPDGHFDFSVVYISTRMVLMSCMHVSLYLYMIFKTIIIFVYFLSPPPQFIVECHGNTLLPQFLGMYRLTVDGVEVYMIVTRNVFSHRLSVYRKYDLKVRKFFEYK